MKANLRGERYLNVGANQEKINNKYLSDTQKVNEHMATHQSVAGLEQHHPPREPIYSG